MKAYRFILFLLVFIFGTFSLAQGVSEDLFYDFEKETPGWTSSTNGSIAQSTQHAKSGSNSLEWKWKNSDATLSVKFPPRYIESYKNNSTHLGLWLYNERPMDKRLHVQAFSVGKEVCSFWFNLHYHGWRVLGANYISLDVPKGALVDQIVFHAPSSSGKLWLDAVKPAFMSTSIQADDQQPWANNPKILKNKSGKTRYSSHNISLNRPYLPAFVSVDTIPKKSKDGMQKIRNVLLQRPEDRREADYSSFPELCKEFDRLGIVDNGKEINGPPLEFKGSGMFLPLPNALSFNESLIPFFEKVSEAIRREKGEDKLKAERMYISMCKYLLDQGLQEGNNNYGWIGNGYDFRHFPSRIFIHGKLLEKEGILDSMLKAVAHLCMGRDMLSNSPYSSCDQFYNFSPHLPLAILMLPDEAERYQRMRAFKQYMDKVILNDLPMGKDGTIHHHQGHHLSYGAYSPPKLIRTQILPFKGTEFFISSQAHEKVSKLAKITAFQSMHGALAPNLYLRSGVPIGVDASALCLHAALLGEPGKDSPIDKEVAAIYLDALNGRETKEAHQFREQGISPKRPGGHISLNLAATAVHRRNDWQAAAAGMVKQFRGLEIYGWMENNNYGKQSRNGSLFITIGNKTGWKREGWNWNFWPGATTSVFKNSVDLFEGYTMYSNTNNMGGGVSQNGNGVWGNDFSLHGVSFKKSIFFFDGKITVITTNIASSTDREIVTTLFQQSADAALTAPTVNGQQVSKFKLNEIHEGNESKSTTLIDSLGNFYYIHKGGQLTFQTQEQEWTYFFKCDLIDPKNNPCSDIRRKRFKETPLSENAKYYKPTKGIFHLAYLNHGTKPEAASCAYSILMQPSREALKQFELAMASATPPISILSQSSDAHVVYDSATQTTGYVVFNPSAHLPAPLKQVSRPGFIMVRDKGERYELTVATGDPSQNEPFIIELQSGQKVSIPPNYPLSGNAVVHKKK